jgi:hypothetical protein
MLVVEALNIFTDKNDVADYEVKVKINRTTIFQGIIQGHERGLGAGELLRSIADSLEQAEGWLKAAKPGEGADWLTKHQAARRK